MLSALSIAAVLALNVTVVLDDNATSYLNFNMIGKILAQTTSGSGSGNCCPNATGPDDHCGFKSDTNKNCCKRDTACKECTGKLC